MFKKISFVFSTLLLSVILTNYALAATPIETPARQLIILDAATHTVLTEKNADESMVPSSMSKLMTAYVVFEHLKNGKLSMDGTFHVSQKAWATQGSKMFVDINTDVKIEDLLRGMIIQSGNDACVVLAEGISGSEESFAKLMNETASRIGLKNSNFVNASGWPDPNHRMTARDLAVLANRLIVDFPEYMHFYKEIDFTYHGIKQGNRNPLLYGFNGADGLKTGHTEDAGYGLTATAMRDGRRLIMVVNGLQSMQQRADESKRLLEWGFREFRNYTLFKPGQNVTDVPVWMGTSKTVSLITRDGLTVTLPNSAKLSGEIKVVYDSPLRAPLAKDRPVANLVIDVPGQLRQEYPLYPANDVAQLGWLQRVFAGIGYLISGE